MPLKYETNKEKFVFIYVYLFSIIISGFYNQQTSKCNNTGNKVNKNNF